MDALIFQGVPVDERETMIEANSHDTEEKQVRQFFSEEELIEKRKTFSQNSISIKKQTEEFKKVESAYKDSIKPLVEENTYVLNSIRAGFVEVPQQLYLIPNYKEGMMGYYNRTGELMESRKLLPEEKQSNIRTGEKNKD